ncbi:MAG: PhoPQ-activated pathogenicity-related family protein [Pirellulales bacterium]
MAPLAAAEPSPAGPLKAYVAEADDSYRWVKRREGKFAGADYAELTLTSQTWKGITWQHQLYILKPVEVDDAAQGLLLIAGGRWKPEYAEPPVPGNDKIPGEAHLLAGIAAQIKAPVAVLLHCPFQPIFDGLTEDAAISYTFEQFVKTGESDWPLLLPMVKSAVRAMDCVQEYSREAWQLEVKKFTISGGSKRGWTTWLTGAVDERAAALAPMVIDVLNIGPQMKHQLFTWGEFSDEIDDYTKRGLQRQMASEAGRALNAIVDPYAYRNDLKQPKLIMLGTNDRYWPLDACNLYWDGLEGEKYLLYVPNNGHGLKDLLRVAGSVAALHQHSAGQLKLPQLQWELAEEGDELRLALTSDKLPKQVSIWRAAADTRDFRESKWESTSISTKGVQYEYRLARPKSGYAAMFGEAVFDGITAPFYLSTNLRIIAAPDAPKATVKKP